MAGHHPGVDDTYEGWPNRETWALHLWLTNDEGLYYTARDQAASGDEQAFRDWVEDDLWPCLYEAAEGRVMVVDVGSLWRVEWGCLTAALREE